MTSSVFPEKLKSGPRISEFERKKPFGLWATPSRISSGRARETLCLSELKSAPALPAGAHPTVDSRVC
jgi:hypothetical protein